MTDPTRGLLDTSVVIDPKLLPDGSAISAVTLAELAAGPHATDNRDERAKTDCNGPLPRGMRYRLMMRGRGYMAACSRQLERRDNPVVRGLLTY